jgi:hypothetical protein
MKVPTKRKVKPRLTRNTTTPAMPQWIPLPALFISGKFGKNNNR